MANNDTIAAFNKSLKMFTSSIKANMKYARVCAELSITHFEKHGDVALCQQFYDAMPKNYVRKAAYVKWLAAHSPLFMEGNKMSKDKSEGAVPFNTKAALQTPFWDFAPDPEAVYFGADDVVTALNRVIKRYENTEKFKAKDDNAKAVLERAEKALANIAAA